GAGLDVRDLLDDGVAAAARPAHRAAHLGDAGVARRELEDRAALEVDAEVEPEDQQRHHADREDQARDGVPQPLPAHEVERDLAPVQAAAEATERGHHASFAGLVRAGTRAVGRGEARHGARAPRRLGSRPGRGGPCPRNFVLASSVIIGLVNVNTTTTSMSVVRPRVKAKPRTPPMAKKYSSAAARNDTVSETRMVRRARLQPRSTAARSERPSRTSSRSRSK